MNNNKNQKKRANYRGKRNNSSKKASSTGEPSKGLSRKSDDLEPTESLRKGYNDPDWYIADRVMFDGVISMPTLDFKGVDSDLPNNVKDNAMGTLYDQKLNAPTVMTYYMSPSIGYDGSDFAGSAVNVAGRKLYAELSASNAKTNNYAPQDVTTLILALGQILAIANHARRMYGITNYYNMFSRTVPKTLLAGCGLNEAQIEEWAHWSPMFRNELNQIIARINSITFPGSLNYFKKCNYIYSNIFVDRDDAMPTYHFMAPFSTWTIDEESYEEGTILSTTNTNTLESWHDIIDILKTMVDEILTSSTYNFIFSDILNLSNRRVIVPDWIKIEYVPIDYVIEPIYSEQFNWQVMNMTILGSPSSDTLGAESTPNNDVYPDVGSNCLKYAPSFYPTDNGIHVPTYEEAVGVKQWTLPVRLPDINISDDEFVELLAYHNIPRTMVSIDEETGDYIGEVKVIGMSDYYCNVARVWYGNEVGFNAGRQITSNISDVDNNPITLRTCAHITNIVHTPLMGTYSMLSHTLNIFSKLGAFTFVNERMMKNLRFETFLGLFVFK